MALEMRRAFAQDEGVNAIFGALWMENSRPFLILRRAL